MSYQNIKCPNCGVYNVNRDYCSKCNTILSYKKRREQEFKKEEEARLEQRRLEKKTIRRSLRSMGIIGFY